MKSDDAPMATIPPGDFWMGIDGAIGLEDERPRHKVWLDAYAMDLYMDLYEVTTWRYARFLAATGRATPLFWEEVDLTTHKDRPVVGVDWTDADAYCRWAGRRLPTEAEWEKAARGTDERRHPGQPGADGGVANFALGARFSYTQVLMPVGRYEQGKSPYGIYDLAGNVWEWVQDWYDGNYYEQSPERNPQGAIQSLARRLLVGAAEIPAYLRPVQTAADHAEQLSRLPLREVDRVAEGARRILTGDCYFHRLLTGWFHYGPSCFDIPFYGR